MTEIKFTSKVTGKTYFIKEDLPYNSKNVINLITCDKCNDQYIASPADFKLCFRGTKSDIKTKNERCGNC